MGQWLIADLSVADVHFQPWMLLVTGVVVFWFSGSARVSPLRWGSRRGRTCGPGKDEH